MVTRIKMTFSFFKKENLIAPFMDEVQLPQGYRAPSRRQFPEIPGTHFIDLGRMKD